MSASRLSAALAALAEAGVDAVVVGAAGLNFYLPQDEPPLATVDVDVLLRPEVPVVRRALSILARLGFTFTAGGEPFVDVDDDAVLQRLIDVGGVLRASRQGAHLDLMLSMGGYSFAALHEDAVAFIVGGQPVRVGKPEKLLRSKELAGRAKDIEFVRAFLARLAPPAAKSKPRRRSGKPRRK